MQKEDKLFSEIYKINQSTNLYMIEIALDHYTDIFNRWDPAPFKRRELDPDLNLYLEGCSEEIPLHYPIELCFIIPSAKHSEELEQEARHGLKMNYTFKLYLLKKELKKNIIKVLRCILLGFGFLALGKFFSSRSVDEGFLTLLSEAVFIGGWVFLWEAVSIFFFTDYELFHRYRIYKRLRDAPVLFRKAEKCHT